MIDEFDSIQDLYKRVLPALRIRVKEARNNQLSIKELDIWNYLVNTKWKEGSNLMLFDIVDDILSTELIEIKKYVDEVDYEK